MTKRETPPPTTSRLHSGKFGWTPSSPGSVPDTTVSSSDCPGTGTTCPVTVRVSCLTYLVGRSVGTEGESPVSSYRDLLKGINFQLSSCRRSRDRPRVHVGLRTTTDGCRTRSGTVYVPDQAQTGTEGGGARRREVGRSNSLFKRPGETFPGLSPMSH